MTCRTKAWASAESAGVVIFSRAATLSPGHVFAWTNHLAVTFRMQIFVEDIFQQSIHWDALRWQMSGAGWSSSPVASLMLLANFKCSLHFLFFILRGSFASDVITGSDASASVAWSIGDGDASASVACSIHEGDASASVPAVREKYFKMFIA